MLPPLGPWCAVDPSRERLTLPAWRGLLGAFSRTPTHKKTTPRALFCLENKQGPRREKPMLAHSAAANASPAHVRPRHLSPVTPSTRPPSPAPTAIGYFATMRAIRSSARLTSTERLVLLMILSHVDNATSEAAVGIPRLAEECHLSQRTIERAVAGLCAAGWLVRDSAASQWGTNIYRIQPRPDDVRPRPRRYGRPFDRVTPDRMSGDPPAQDRVTPDVGSGILPLPLHGETPVCAAPAPAEQEAPESTHTEVFEVEQEAEELAPALAPVELHEAPAPAEQEAPAEQGIAAALSSHPELQALARPPVVAILAAERRPLPVVRRALAELAEHAAAAAAVGEPFSVATLARKARAYVRRAYETGESRPTSPPTPAPAEEPPPPAPQLLATVANLRGILAALGARHA